MKRSPKDFLNRILEKRKERTNGYSIRAFARDLGVSAATLSLVLSGKTEMSLRLARKVLRLKEFCEMSSADITEFKALVERRSKSGKRVRKAAAHFEDFESGLNDISGTIMTIDPELVPWARKEIRRFRINLARKLQASENASRVYYLGIQLFPVNRDGE